MNANNINNNIDNDGIILKVCFSLSAFYTSLTVTTMSLYLLQLLNKALRLAEYLHDDSWQSIIQMRDTMDSNKVNLLNENRRRGRKPSQQKTVTLASREAIDAHGCDAVKNRPTLPVRQETVTWLL